MKVKESFSYAHPSEIVSAVQKYSTAFYGSNLYALRSYTASQLYGSWRTRVKLIWDLPRECHNNFLDAILAQDVIPPQISLMTRFVTFFHSLINSPSPEVSVLCRLSARDLHSNIGLNLDDIKRETGLDPWLFGSRRIREEMLKFHSRSPPKEDAWRIPYLHKLLSIRTEYFYRGDSFNYEEINSLIFSLVTN